MTLGPDDEQRFCISLRHKHSDYSTYSKGVVVGVVLRLMLVNAAMSMHENPWGAAKNPNTNSHFLDFSRRASTRLYVSKPIKSIIYTNFLPLHMSIHT
jgi:hypothetical protein